MNTAIRVGALALILSSAVVLAEPTDAAYEAYQSGDYATALRLWKPRASRGEANPQNSVGTLYALGQGVPQDYAEAAMWYRKAAEQGLAVAQENLGHIYLHGNGVAKDYAEAAKWYRKAANQRRNKSQKALGFMYLQGQSVPQDYVLAHMWFNLASADGDEEAKRQRDNLAARLMTPTQLAEAQKFAREWKPDAANEREKQAKTAGQNAGRHAAQAKADQEAANENAERQAAQARADQQAAYAMMLERERSAQLNAIVGGLIESSAAPATPLTKSPSAETTVCKPSQDRQSVVCTTTSK